MKELWEIVDAIAGVNWTLKQLCGAADRQATAICLYLQGLAAGQAERWQAAGDLALRQGMLTEVGEANKLLDLWREITSRINANLLSPLNHAPAAAAAEKGGENA